MSNRKTLPDRRFAQGIAFECAGQPYMAHVGRYPDNDQIAEIFVTSIKTGTHVDTSAREASTILSMALQYGAEFESIRRALPRDPRGAATGPVGTIMDLLSEKNES